MKKIMKKNRKKHHVSIVLTIFAMIFVIILTLTFYNNTKDPIDIDEIRNNSEEENTITDSKNDIEIEQIVEIEPKEIEIEDIPEEIPDNPIDIEQNIEQYDEQNNNQENNTNEENSPEDIAQPKKDFPMPNTFRSDELLALELQETQLVNDSYFNDALIVGDSVSLGLQLYVTSQRKKNPDFMGELKFFVGGSFSVYHALESVKNSVPAVLDEEGNELIPEKKGSLHPSYQGIKMLTEDVIELVGAKKVYICLGLNDIGIYGLEKFLNYYNDFIYRIRVKNPDVQIIIVSVTPVTRNGERGHIYNYRFDLYNDALIEFAHERGCYFLDIAMILKDEEGYLPDKYSSDDYVHLTFNAYEKWINYMRTHII